MNFTEAALGRLGAAGKGLWGGAFKGQHSSQSEPVFTLGEGAFRGK